MKHQLGLVQLTSRYKVSTSGHLDQGEGEGEAKRQARPLEPVPLHEGVQAGRDVVKEVATRSHLNEDVEL